MLRLRNLLPLALVAAFLAPGTALADWKDHERHRRERAEWEYRDDDRGWYGRGYPHGYRSEREWRKAERKRHREMWKAWREREKHRRKAEREWRSGE